MNHIFRAHIPWLLAHSVHHIVRLYHSAYYYHITSLVHCGYVVVITQCWLHNAHAYCCYYYNRFLTYRFLANKTHTHSHFKVVNSHIENKRQHQSFWPTFIYRNPFPTVFGAKNAINYCYHWTKRTVFRLYICPIKHNSNSLENVMLKYKLQIR